ncbi:MAG: DUF1064 domain-containing protein [Pseudohongiellaceae bacterium]
MRLNDLPEHLRQQLSPSELELLDGPKGKGRYGNVTKPEIDGIRFDSKREMQRYLDLKLLEKAGRIKNLVLQPRFPIEIGGVQIRIMSKRYNKTGRQVVYIADFKYFDLDLEREIIEDVKMQSGHRPEAYIIKRALMLAMGKYVTEV